MIIFRHRYPSNCDINYTVCDKTHLMEKFTFHLFKNRAKASNNS